MKTAAAALLLLLAALAALHAQDFSDAQPVYGYKFVPSDPNSGYGGEVWFSQQQYPFPSNPSENVYDGINFYFGAPSCFLLTPVQAININSGYSFGPVAPVLPQSPFPYTGKISVASYRSEFDGSGFGNSVTWNQTGVTFMKLSGSGSVDWHSSPATISSFVDTNIFGVFETYSWTATATNISWQFGFTPETYGQEINDPGFSGSENGKWVPISPPLVLSTANTSTGGVFGFNVSGPPGATVIIEASSDLKTWIPIQTNSIGGGSLYFSDPQSQTNTLRFYRAISL